MRFLKRFSSIRLFFVISTITFVYSFLILKTNALYISEFIKQVNPKSKNSAEFNKSSNIIEDEKVINNSWHQDTTQIITPEKEQVEIIIEAANAGDTVENKKYIARITWKKPSSQPNATIGDFHSGFAGELVDKHDSNKKYYFAGAIFPEKISTVWFFAETPPYCHEFGGLVACAREIFPNICIDKPQDVPSEMRKNNWNAQNCLYESATPLREY